LHVNAAGSSGLNLVVSRLGGILCVIRECLRLGVMSGWSARVVRCSIVLD
jgi:hypothetical protein